MSHTAKTIGDAVTDALRDAAHDGERELILLAITSAITANFMPGRGGQPRPHVRHAQHRLRVALDDVVIGRHIYPAPVNATYAPTLTSLAATLDIVLVQDAAERMHAVELAQAKRSPGR